MFWVPLDPQPKKFNMGAISLLLLRNSMFTFHNYTTQMKQKIACKCLIVHSTMLWDSLHLHYLYNVQLWRAQTFKILWVYFMLCTICFTFYLGYCCHRIENKIVKSSFLIGKLQIKRIWSLIADTDYGRSMKPFFHRNPNFLGRQFGQTI